MQNTCKEVDICMIQTSIINIFLLPFYRLKDLTGIASVCFVHYNDFKPGLREKGSARINFKNPS